MILSTLTLIATAFIQHRAANILLPNGIKNNYLEYMFLRIFPDLFLFLDLNMGVLMPKFLPSVFLQRIELSALKWCLCSAGFCPRAPHTHLSLQPVSFMPFSPAPFVQPVPPPTAPASFCNCHLMTPPAYSSQPNHDRERAWRISKLVPSIPGRLSCT